MATTYNAVSPFSQGGVRAIFHTLLLTLILFATTAVAQSFPPLTSRVVDAANILRSEDRGDLEAKLKTHEDRTTNQVVVATISSLNGLMIEDYANRLYRHWQLGQREKNNGVLLLVAPRERKVRIEVGYGLEGVLTDALSKVIIATAIAPRFQQGDFAAGLNGGVDAILNILTGDADEWQRRIRVREEEGSTHPRLDPIIAFILLLILFWIIARLMSAWRSPRHAHRQRRGGWIVIPSGGGWSGGGDWTGGGGFSGGGGSSGGGGASGSW